MDHRERILAAMRHQPVDRVPTDMWATPEVQEKLFAHFGIESGHDTPVGPALCGGGTWRGVEALVALFDRLDIDGIFNIAPPYIGPELRTEGDYSENAWGMGSRSQAYATGVYSEQVHYPLAQAETIDDLAHYRWPTRTGTTTRHCRGWPRVAADGRSAAATRPRSTITTCCAG